MSPIDSFIQYYDSSKHMFDNMTEDSKAQFYRYIIKSAIVLLMRYDIPYPDFGYNKVSNNALKGILDHYVSLIRSYKAATIQASNE